MADCSERKLATYEKSPSIPANGLRRIRETVRLIQALQELAGEHEALKEWLHKPNKAFHKRSPIELITQGESDILWGMVHQLRYGAFA
ncbi:MAG: antitoxin Xre/MbcA/ParS toxin-binding domain-containing protein [Luteolibacter sp.]